ncbi:hypothetical protein AYL99_02049 [Fonsecaea erecta]|uniref:Uncharacterized protein n=1 Tax=Fonsecaea erecta TaxID=1367422 RepID=A0A178ZSY4_9EURO|nr:hypothetical protein AYL99_02049 [Fonsecaea erecta]OAP62822.1 hypothetical protein AYL99_02049 [Fonsecaea erecta]
MAETAETFDPSQFESEIQAVSQDINTMIDITQYESMIEFFQRLSGSGADVSHDQNLEQGMEDLHAAVSSIQTAGNSAGGGVWSDPLVTSCVHQLRSEGKCLNIFVFLDQMHNDGVDFSFDQQLQFTMNNVAVQLEGVTTVSDLQPPEWIQRLPLPAP